MAMHVSPDAPAFIHAAAGAILLLHIAGGTVGLVSGAVAMATRKGGRLHRAAGNVFFAAMLVMAGLGGAAAPFMQKAQWTNTVAGFFTAYLVASAWMTVRRRPGEVGLYEKAAALLPTGIALTGLTLAATSFGTEAFGGFAAVYVFAGVAALAATCDLRMIARGGLTGTPRLARHVWRISLGFFIASGSFFYGQRDVLPQLIGETPLPTALAFAPLVLMIFWLIRIRLPRRSKQPRPARLPVS
ncbi:hypothetical protein [Phenylobacterium sp.]|uniref:hypothetical protein n=1 Tax=Phenylobacterium sp. TaxID=1871053 RepID=UPI00286ACA92|nr:hypothetical protein [Phenylobacterium sp.]